MAAFSTPAERAHPPGSRRGGFGTPLLASTGEVAVFPWRGPGPAARPWPDEGRPPALVDAALQRERSRLARELHDVVGQALTAVRLSIMVARQASDPDELDGRLASSLELVDSAIGDVRTMAMEMRPIGLDLGLASAVRSYIRRHEPVSPVVMELRESGCVRAAPGAEAAAFQIVREAITNALVHASARRVVVRIRQAPESLVVSIADDGVGFDVEEASSSPASLGLRGMRERAQLSGGRLELRSRAGRGTRVTVAFTASTG